MNDINGKLIKLNDKVAFACEICNKVRLKQGTVVEITNNAKRPVLKIKTNDGRNIQLVLAEEKVMVLPK